MVLVLIDPFRVVYCLVWCGGFLLILVFFPFLEVETLFCGVVYYSAAEETIQWLCILCGCSTSAACFVTTSTSSWCQAYVRFVRALDRDIVIQQGPIPFDNVTLTFVRHNEGRNWRRVLFNTECQLMLMGFPPDCQEEDYYQDAIGSFGKFLYLQQEERRLTRVIIRARVIDLQSIPHFIVFSESEGFESDSWIVQCEIL